MKEDIKELVKAKAKEELSIIPGWTKYRDREKELFINMYSMGYLTGMRDREKMKKRMN